MDFEMTNGRPKDASSLEDSQNVYNPKENKKVDRNFRNVWKKVSYNHDRAYIHSHNFYIEIRVLFDNNLFYILGSINSSIC